MPSSSRVRPVGCVRIVTNCVSLCFVFFFRRTARETDETRRDRTTRFSAVVCGKERLNQTRSNQTSPLSRKSDHIVRACSSETNRPATVVRAIYYVLSHESVSPPSGRPPGTAVEERRPCSGESGQQMPYLRQQLCAQQRCVLSHPTAIRGLVCVTRQTFQDTC